MSWNNVTPAWVLKKDKPMQYAVIIEVDADGWMYVLDGDPSIEGVTPVKVFDTREEAQVEADRWNTGEVVEWREGKK